MIEGKTTQPLKIETIESPFGTVSFCPERGGIITSLKFKGKEILYLDQATFLDRNVNVKGGIPILFPNAGPIPDELKQEPLGNLPQHGFARNSNRWVSEPRKNGFVETLTSDENTKKIFPYDFEFSIIGIFEEDGSFTITQQIQNTGKNTMPLSMGLHPYFQVPSNEKVNIKFNFPGGNFVRDNIDKWANGEAVTMDNPQFLDNKVKIEVQIPTVGIFIFDIPKEYQKMRVWSLQGKGFICVEPIMRSEEGIIKNPEEIKSGATFSIRYNISLKKE